MCVFCYIFCSIVSPCFTPGADRDGVDMIVRLEGILFSSKNGWEMDNKNIGLSDVFRMFHDHFENFWATVYVFVLSITCTHVQHSVHVKSLNTFDIADENRTEQKTSSHDFRGKGGNCQLRPPDFWDLCWNVKAWLQAVVVSKPNLRCFH